MEGKVSDSETRRFRGGRRETDELVDSTDTCVGYEVIVEGRSVGGALLEIDSVIRRFQ